MPTLTVGQRLPLCPSGQGHTVRVQARVTHPDVDISLFPLNEARQMGDDRYLVFFNQPSTPGGEIRMTRAGDLVTFEIHVDRLPEWISRLVLVATSDSQAIGRMSSGEVRISVGAAEEVVQTLTPGGKELALMLTEIYRHGGGWRLGGVEQGFVGGMDALIRSFGGEVVQESTPTPTPTPTPKPAESATVPAAQPPAPPSKVDLRKEKVALVLKKSGIESVKARVMVVMDASGSMDSLYSSGTVQDTLERLIPVALRLDDNASMEFWYYASKFARMGDLDQDSVEGVAGNAMPQIRAVVPAVRKIGYGNNEPPVMEDVLSVHRAAIGEDRPSDTPTLPTLVLFITDGGIDANTSKKIEKIIKDSASEPLFWQFLGLGRADYGVLSRLDTLRGRVIDNSGFFALDDINGTGDESLYTQLLSEFALWWKKWQTLPAASGAASRVAPLAAPRTAPASTGIISLKKNASVDIAKGDKITITLSWKGRGDLDLYAFYVLKDGSVGKVYYRDKGSANRAPYITLSGDSRGAGKETAVIHQPRLLSHVVFAAYSAVENGAGSFASYQPTTIFTDNLGQEVRTPVMGRNHFSFWVALSAIDLTGATAKISHLERYSSFGTERSPLLHNSGKLEMNKGVVEFKGH